MDLPDKTSTIKDIKTYLKSINAVHTFKTKADYLKRIICLNLITLFHGEKIKKM